MFVLRRMLLRMVAVAAVGVLLMASIPPLLVATEGSSVATGGAAMITLHRQVSEVHVSFTVEDSRKRLVRDIVAGQIKILDDGRPVSSITSFGENSDLPLRLAFLLDCSDSMRKNFAGEVAAAQAFVERLLRPDIDSLLFIDFAGQSTISQAPANTYPTVIAARMNSLAAAGHTAVYDAIYEAATRVMNDNREPQPVRRVLILLSDGEDNDSRHGRAEAIEMAQRADIVIYAITAHSRRFEYQGDAILRRMAEATGGRAFVLGSFDDVGKVFSEIESELRSQYTMTFRPVTPDRCGFHSVQVVYGTRKMKVRAREGYYSCSISGDSASR
jgi:Ca-activated chloride channel family protein